MSSEAEAFNEHALVHGLSIAFGGASPVLSVTLGTFLLVLAVSFLVAAVFVVRRIIRMMSQVKNCRRSTMIQPYILSEHDRLSKEVGASEVSSSRDVESQNIRISLNSSVHDAYMKLIGKGEIVTPQPGVNHRSPKPQVPMSEQGMVNADQEAIPDCPPSCFCHAYGGNIDDERSRWWTSPIMIPETPTLDQPRQISSIRTRSWTSDEAYHFVHGFSRSEGVRDSFASSNHTYRLSGATGEYVANRDFRFPLISAVSGSLSVPPTSFPPSLSFNHAPSSRYCSRSLARPVTWHSCTTPSAISASTKTHSDLALSPLITPFAFTMSSRVNNNSEETDCISAVDKLISMSRQEYHDTEVAKWKEALKASEEAYRRSLEKSLDGRIRAHETVHIAEPKPAHIKANDSYAPRRVLGDVTNRRAVRITVPVIPVASNVTNAASGDGNRRVSS